MAKNIKFDFDDVLIEPSMQTSISSRKDVDCFYNNKLPLMTAPMDTVVNIDNFEKFINLGYTVVFPRTIKFNDFINNFDDGDELLLKTIKEHFFSYGLDEFKNICESKESFFLPKNILVDIANGHMDIIKEYSIKFKEKYPYKVLMIGNIANPKTYKCLAETQCIDLLRVGIGNGGGCWVDNTLIKCINGYKYIKDIEINDEVLTHDGTYQIVTNKISYINNDELYNINGDICTEDHEIFVVDLIDRNKINSNNYLEYGYWVTAKHLDDKKHLIVSMEDNV